MAKLFTPLIIALCASLISCAPKDPYTYGQATRTNKKTYSHKGQFATYEIETTLGSAFDGLHLSTFALKIKQPNESIELKTLPTILDVFTYYDTEWAHVTSGDTYDSIVFPNGKSTGEEGYADGVVIISLQDETSLLTWRFNSGQIEILGKTSNDMRKLARTSIEKTAKKNQNWSW